MNLAYVLDCMTATGYPVPGYVHYRKNAAASAGVPDTDESVLDSREKVWLAAVKLACTPMRKLRRNILFHKIAAAASRYGVRRDTEDAVAWVDRLGNRTDGIRTPGDFQKAADWLRRYADRLDPDVRVKLAEHLLDGTAGIGHVLSLSERFELDEWAGRDPCSPELRDLAERNLHKLASGNVYRTDQFAAIPLADLRDSLPDLAKIASLGMNVADPMRLAQGASALTEKEATIVDALFDLHGQRPVHSEIGAPVVIDDAILASL